MKQFTEKRPTAVTVIGWFWIIAGSWLLFNSIVTMYEGPPSESFVEEIAKGSVLVAMLMSQYRLQIFLMAAFGILAMISGICFLRLLAWARTVLEFLSWLSIVITGVQGILGILFMGGGFVVTAFAIVATAFLWVPLAFIIRSLRSKKVRDAFADDLEQEK